MHEIRILNVVHSMDIGGMENGLVNIINRSDSSLFQHDICCMSRDGRLAKRIVRDDCNIFSLNKKEGFDVFLFYKIWKIINEKKYDIIHTRNWSAFDAIVPGRFSKGSKIVHSEHGTGFSGQIRRRIIARRILDGFISGYVTVSKSLQNWMCNSVGIKSGKIQIIPNGVDTDRFSPGLERKETLLHIPSQSCVIGYVGRLDRIKNIPALIHAFSGLLNDFKKLYMVIVGDGPQEKPLKRMVADLNLLDKVHFTGSKDDVVPYLRSVDVFVLPSELEGMSNTILEAMAVGLPVVAFKVGGNPEIVEHRKTGFLVDEKTPEALSDGIAFYLKNPHLIREHGNGGLRRAFARFSLSKMVKEYEMLYLKLVRGARI